MVRVLTLASVLLAATAARADGLMFPVPAGTDSAKHVVLAPGIGEQDYFWVNAPYPETPALAHYQKVFSGWVECKPWRTGWMGFADSSGSKERYVHRFSRHWISAENDRAAMLLFKYESAGLNYRVRPDNDRQLVAVVVYRVPNAAAYYAQMNIDCSKAPNRAVERDGPQAARPSP